jgi:hypothetical protein
MRASRSSRGTFTWGISTSRNSRTSELPVNRRSKPLACRSNNCLRVASYCCIVSSQTCRLARNRPAAILIHPGRLRRKVIMLCRLWRRREVVSIVHAKLPAPAPPVHPLARDATGTSRATNRISATCRVDLGGSLMKSKSSSKRERRVGITFVGRILGFPV